MEDTQHLCVYRMPLGPDPGPQAGMWEWGKFLLPNSGIQNQNIHHVFHMLLEPGGPR